MADPERRRPDTATPPRKAAALRPRDAATLVIVDRSGETPRILMGRRRPDQVFLPDTFVFPGGRVESADRAFARHHGLPSHEAQSLKLAMRGRVSDIRASALALAAVRETFEETGYILGKKGPHDSRAPGGWAGFLAEGYCPHLDGLSFFARAVTPPGRPRRYDTRFFMADASLIAHRAGAIDGELLDIDWYTVERARCLKLPSITRHVIEDVASLLSRQNDTSEVEQPAPVPFYFHRNGRFQRTLLHAENTPAKA